ncbi:MAG: NAD+ synthase [Candidatus Aquiluna sp.]|nr:NAD+ synthase [Aquiluna sp.]
MLVQEIRIGFGQINPVVGDFAHNSKQILQIMNDAAGKVDLLIFGELALCGYPLGDLSYRADIISATQEALEQLVAESAEPRLASLTVVLGHVSAAATHSDQQSSYASAHNSATVFSGGEVIGRYDKKYLPNYDVFDDWRNFVPGSSELLFELQGQRVAVAICEDIWHPEAPQRDELANAGVDLLVVPNGSPYTRDIQSRRRNAARSYQRGFAIAYANLAGGQDDLVFDGDSFLMGKDGQELYRAGMEPGLFITETKELEPVLDDEPQRLYEVLVTGLRDYCGKTGQDKVLLGFSGGIDSSLTAAIAVDALGSQAVLGIGLPSRYSSDHSLADAQQLANNLGCEFRVIPIDKAHVAFEDMVDLKGLAGENVQARIRAVTLMAISNSEGRLLLTTGNKSEIAVGYSTMYGDSAGGFAPIKDILKTDVWRLARWLNASRGKELIPMSSIEKPPSAELSPGQLDSDSLPDYNLLDDILRLLIEKTATVDEVVALGFERELVSEVDSKVRAAEWKRSQGAIGTKTTAVAFGSGRRVPITTRFGKL